MTFVKTKLLIERMRPGEVARIRLKGAEPLENVPRSVREFGHEVLDLTPEGPGPEGSGPGGSGPGGSGPGGSGPEGSGDDAGAVHVLTVRKSTV